uniref:Uncharacterized protein n=1 Tax=Anguilla anguilla TaxID=7936 RepID=A0A0E9WE19_ANGAN
MSSTFSGYELKNSVLSQWASSIPWSPTRMMFTQRCRFICFSPSISCPTILSISLSGLFSSLLKGPSLWPKVSGCSEWTAYT